jgi:hypothetical protein
LHNYSKHRARIGKVIVADPDRGIIKSPLIDPRTGKGIRIPNIDYLDDSYKEMEKLQKRVRDKIHKYHSSSI